MVASTKLLSKRLLLAGLIVASSIVFVVKAPAFPPPGAGNNGGPANTRGQDPTQPAPSFIPPRQVDDNRFVRPFQQQQQQNNNNSGTSGSSGLSGGSNGFGGSGGFLGGTGGGGTSGGFFGMGRFGKMPRMMGQPNDDEPVFHGTFNFGGFKGYGFGGGDMSTWRNSERQPMSGGASHTDSK
jgi:hypothetical protein